MAQTSCCDGTKTKSDHWECPVPAILLLPEPQMPHHLQNRWLEYTSIFFLDFFCAFDDFIHHETIVAYHFRACIYYIGSTSVVSIQTYTTSILKKACKLHNVLDISTSEPVYTLPVVTYTKELSIRIHQGLDKTHLYLVDILKFVHQHILILLKKFLPDFFTILE